MKSILEKIEDERVFTIKLSRDKKELNIQEYCDRWFDVNLTKNEALKMIDEINLIISQMDDSE